MDSRRAGKAGAGMERHAASASPPQFGLYPRERQEVQSAGKGEVQKPGRNEGSCWFLSWYLLR